MFDFKYSIFSFVAVLFFALTPPAFAGADVNTAIGAVLVEGKPAPGLAVHGFDVVAFFTQSKPVHGDARFATVHDGATYRFASAKNLAVFQENPSRYAPAYGGYCAYGVSVGAKFDGDPRYWKIVDGRLYLNLSDDIQKAWLKDVQGSIQKANDQWPSLANKLPSEIK
jgi:YHS domain-containing protein